MTGFGTLASLQVGLPAQYPLNITRADRPSDASWRTGFVKEPVTDRRFLSLTQIEGDGQADIVNHGGKDKAVLVYAARHYRDWEEELASELAAHGSFILPKGAFGENFTVTEWSEDTVCIGDVLSVGTAVVEVCQPRVPCWKISERWGIPDLLTRVQNTGRTGWYLRVQEEGFVQAGDSLKLLHRRYPNLTISLLNDVIHKRLLDESVMREIAKLPELAAACRKIIEHRIDAVQAT